MKTYTITVNGNVYNVTVEEGQTSGAPAAAPAQTAGWTCSCGKTGNTGKFCSECGAPQPVAEGWTCSCGAVNEGKFCS